VQAFGEDEKVRDQPSKLTSKKGSFGFKRTLLHVT